MPSSKKKRGNNKKKRGNNKKKQPAQDQRANSIVEMINDPIDHFKLDLMCTDGHWNSPRLSLEEVASSCMHGAPRLSRPPNGIDFKIMNDARKIRSTLINLYIVLYQSNKEKNHSGVGKGLSVWSLISENWGDEATWKYVKALLVSQGVFLIMHGEEMSMLVRFYAELIMCIENCYGGKDKNLIIWKAQDLHGNGARGVTRFYAKRIPCSCLDEKKKQVKKQTSTRFCQLCRLKYKKNSLKVCGSCNIATYCCRECQVADWPLHKTVCSKLASLSALYKI